ncbi:transcription termination/antitermination protein NusG [Mesorhizobium sp. ANAO-SY3R2]|uniref:transcription termination/antitermination protein NusG n=1 Tax=Mesorhizobium sp. ANAO-SY3R2 TaxID=3166644 RepID=UPI00366E3A33
MLQANPCNSVSGPLEGLHDGRNARWYAVQTHQHSESLAERHLLTQNFQTYLPKRKRTVRHARSVRTVCGAYFDCYLFVSLDIQKQRWPAINSTVGVRRLLMSDSAPIPVPNGVVEALLSSTDEDGILHSENLLQSGQTVRVAQGPFADQLGTLDYVGRVGAVRVLLDIMNRSVPVYIDRDKVIIL